MTTQTTDSALLDQAISFYQAGQLPEAIVIFKHMLLNSPNDTGLLTNLGTLSLQVGNFEESLAFNQQSLALNPQQVIAHVHQGIAFQQLNQAEQAVASYDRAIKVDPDYAGAFYNRGNALHDLHRLPEAVASYDQAIAINPQYASAFSNRGIALHELECFEAAVSSYDQAIAINHDYAEAYSNRGLSLRELDRFEEAILNYDQAIIINPAYAEAYNNRGIALQDVLRFDEAVASYDQAILINPNHPAANFNRGNALRDLLRFADSITSYDRAIVINPHNAEAYANRGISQHDLQQFDEAMSSYDSAIAINANYAGAHYNRGVTLNQLKRFDDAIDSYDAVLALASDYPDVAFNRGNALTDLSRFSEAVLSYDQAIALNPDSAQAYYNRGNVLNLLQRFDEAVASYDGAINLNSDYAEAYSNRGGVFNDLQRFDEAINSFEQAIRLKPDIDFLFGLKLHTQMHVCDWSNLDSQLQTLKTAIEQQQKISTPFAVLALIDDPQLQQQAAAIFVKAQQPKLVNLLLKKYRPHDKIHVAYFSADYHDHATMHLMAELFEHHNPQQFELTAFAFGSSNEDKWRKRAKSAFGSFINVRNLSDSDIVLMARLLEIDIAVDLKGFTTDARPGIFAQRAAPIQVNYLGYPGTMASSYIDYMIADQTLISDQNRQFYSENMVYLPNSYQANASHNVISSKIMTRAAVGLPENSFVFCSFNNTFKITPACFDSWMRILQQVENSVLWLYVSNQTAINNLKKEALKRGVAEQRLVFATHLPVEEHLARIGLADLFLDTQPYNAHTTASDALRMGLPLLTCIGEAFASRVAASLLTALGLPELIADNTSEYEAMAIDLARQPDKLKRLRQQLKANLNNANLFNTPLFSKHIESAYQQMYQKHRRGEAMGSIFVRE